MRPHNTEAIRSGMTAPHADTARQARRIAGLRGNSLGISLMLIAEYGLGIGVSLYVHIPAADPGEQDPAPPRSAAADPPLRPPRQRRLGPPLAGLPRERLASRTRRPP